MKLMKSLFLVTALVLALTGCMRYQDKMELLTGEQAKSYALSALGIDLADASFTQLTLETRGDIQYYSVKLTANDTEYVCSIDALSGAVLDSSSSSPTPAATPTGTPYPLPDKGTPAANLSEQDAKEKALRHADIPEADVIFVKCEKDMDDGKAVYDIEFNTIYGENYEYEIDMYSGAVLDFDYDANGYVSMVTPKAEPTTAPQDGTGNTPIPPHDTPEPTPHDVPAPDPAPKAISESDAKAKALAHAKLSADDVTFVKCRKDKDDGRSIYEIEFLTNFEQAYSYEIDMYSGEVVSFDYDAMGHAPTTPQNALSESDAKAKALAQVPGATESNIREFEVDRDDGRIEYEGKIVYDGMEYEFEIDGYSGAIRSWEAERVGS